MKKKSYFVLIALCFLLAGTACQSRPGPSSNPAGAVPQITAPELPEPEADDLEPEPAPELSQRERDWLEDIEFLREACKTEHMDPFYLCPEEEFDRKLDHLSAKVGELSDEDITFEIVSIIAGLGDPHSYASPTAALYDRRFPAAARYFDGKLYLTACMEGFELPESCLLHEIVAVNGVDIAYLDQKVDSIGNPFNRWYSRECFQTLYFIPAFFDWAGCDYKEGYTFQILNDDWNVESVEIPVISNAERKAGTWAYPENWDNLTYLQGRNFADYLDGENGGCVYMSLAELMSKSDIQRLIRKAGELLEAHPDCDKLVIDLRQTPGGNASLVQCFQEDAAQVLGTEHTYVLTGGATGSAAITFVAYFKDEMGATTVGEPTGQFTSMFHMQTSVDGPSILPHSQISVQLSNAWWDGDPIIEEQYDKNGRLYEWESTILPDVFVYQDIEDIRQGKDSVIEWIFDQ